MNEPLRLAQFLRQRCAQNLYGLCYLDEEQTLLQIPWPVVPKHTGDAPPEFQIYHVSIVRKLLSVKNLVKQSRDSNCCNVSFF